MGYKRVWGVQEIGYCQDNMRPNIYNFPRTSLLCVTLDSGRGKRRLFGRRVAGFPRRASSKNKVQGGLEGLPQVMWVLGASAATPGNSRLL